MKLPLFGPLAKIKACYAVLASVTAYNFLSILFSIPAVCRLIQGHASEILTSVNVTWRRRKKKENLLYTLHLRFALASHISKCEWRWRKRRLDEDACAKPSSPASIATLASLVWMSWRWKWSYVVITQIDRKKLGGHHVCLGDIMQNIAKISVFCSFSEGSLGQVL